MREGCAALLFLLLAAPAAGSASPPPSDPPSDIERLDDLPLIEVPTHAPGRDEMAVLLTGDGGWAVSDKGISRSLAARGIPVVGWNSLRYYWSYKSPERAASDLELILRHYLPLWQKERIVLIGYSFGADVLPFLINRLPADLGERIDKIVLLGLIGSAEFDFHFFNWLNKVADDSLPVLPELERLRGRRILCAYGEKEKDSFCPRVPEDLAERLVRPGGHVIGKNFGTIVDWITKNP
jgi:type IV secretory pathway VirJ component